MSDIVLDRTDPAVPVVVIDRPRRRNALDHAAWRDLGTTFRQLGGEAGVRGVILTGAGGAFCAGDDILAFASVRDDPAARSRYWDDIMACYAAISEIRVPVIAAVSGPCVGGGCTLALRADFRIGDPTARFGVPPAKLGLVYPADSTRLLIAAAGLSAARHMLYTGALIDAQAAAACGLVAAIAEGDVVEAARRFLAPMIDNAPISIAAAKLACDAAMAGDFNSIIPEIERLSQLADRSDDYREGARAFAEKRKPRFTGQ